MCLFPQILSHARPLAADDLALFHRAAVEGDVEEIGTHDHIAGDEALRLCQGRVGKRRIGKDLAVRKRFNPAAAAPIQDVAVLQTVGGQYLGQGGGHD